MASTKTLEKACYNAVNVRLSSAFLFSQKSKIFDSFPPGEAFAASPLSPQWGDNFQNALYDKMKFTSKKLRRDGTAYFYANSAKNTQQEYKTKAVVFDF